MKHIIYTPRKKEVWFDLSYKNGCQLEMFDILDTANIIIETKLEEAYEEIKRLEKSNKHVKICLHHNFNCQKLVNKGT